MDTLTLQEAAAFLKIHPVTLLEKAHAGEIPGAKMGKRWVFVKVDLIDCIRSQYKRRALQGEHMEETICHFTNAKTPQIGGSKSRHSMDDRYSKALGLPTDEKRRSSMTS
ncbi:MAG: DNA-binding protein [Oxalobacter sp.]|nr:MAG: DNA-binding protein [Oxalobacter sp.]